LGKYGEASLKGLAHVAEQQDVKRVVVEANFGEGVFTQLLKPIMNRIHSVAIDEVKHCIQMERRICDTLEPIMTQHRLVMSEGDRAGPQAHHSPRQLIYQLAHITIEKSALKHEDRLHALAMAVA